jgi:hypothetical protein
VSLHLPSANGNGTTGEGAVSRKRGAIPPALDLGATVAGTGNGSKAPSPKRRKLDQAAE